MDEFIEWASKSPEINLDSLPWGLADDEFPLGEAALLKAQDEHSGSKSFIRKTADQWYEDFDYVIPENETNPGQVTVHTPCGELASTCSSKCGFPVDLVEQFVDILEIAVLRCGAAQYEELVLRFSPRSEPRIPNRFVLVLVDSYLKKPHFSCDLGIMQRVGGGSVSAPMRAEVKQEIVHGFTVDALRSETDIAFAVLSILNIGDDTNIAVKDRVQIDRAEHKTNVFSFYDITSFKELSVDELAGRQRRASNASVAARSFRAAMAGPKAKPLRPQRKKQTTTRQGQSSFRHVLVPVRQQIRIEDDASEADGSVAPMSDQEAWSDAVATDDAHSRAEARRSSVTNRKGNNRGASSQPSAQPSGRDSCRSVCAHGKSQREVWECAGTSFIKLKRDQEWDGLSLACYCCGYAKNIYFSGGGITREEAAYRLAAWALDCPGGKAEHRNKGGKLLVEYA